MTSRKQTKKDKRQSSKQDKEDEDLAAEIEDLKNRGILPRDFPRKGNSGASDDTEELIGTAQSLTVDKTDQIADQIEELDNLEHVPGFDVHGAPENWASFGKKTKRQKESKYHLFPLGEEEEEFQRIKAEFETVGVTVDKVERLQNAALMKRFIQEEENIKQDRTDGNYRYV